MLPDRYTGGNLVAALRNPKLLTTELHRAVSYHLFTARHGAGIDVMKEDWDNLLILDACRYDYFAERVRRTDLSGTLSRVVSRGPESWIFMRRNFVGRELFDTVYVSANPHVANLGDGTFHRIEPLLDCWDPEAETILPEDVVTAALAAHESHPDKRLVVHFMQPHIPYIGETAARIRDDVDVNGLGVGDQRAGGNRWWDAVERGQITRAETHAAYVESLDIALSAVERLVDGLDGKTVVTADHGELLGERLLPFGRRRYGHPPVHTPALRIVPWFEMPAEERREVVAEAPTSSERLDDAEVDDRLEALGYV